jgi:hypothetical protein
MKHQSSQWIKKPPCLRLKKKTKIKCERCSLLSFSPSEVLCIMRLFLELNSEPRIQPDHFMASVRIDATNCRHYVYQVIYLKIFQQYALTAILRILQNQTTFQLFLWLPPPSGKVHLPRPIHDCLF